MIAVLAALVTMACGVATDGSAADADGEVRHRLEIVDSYPHDPNAYTQGLLVRGRRLFESTGLRGRSTLREVDLDSGRVRRSVDLPPSLFGEGLALVDDRLIQLTWTSGIARVYGVEDFELRREFRYETQGWGLCFDGLRLVMSDGTDQLYFRNPETFALEGRIGVHRKGVPLERLNELECVGDRVYANVFGSDWIYEIDPENGGVTAAIDASGLLDENERASTDVLNGIAYRAQTDTFLLTGKLWPRLFEVRFVPADAAPSASSPDPAPAAPANGPRAPAAPLPTPNDTTD